MGQFQGRGERCGRAGTVQRLFHQTRRAHDLILVARFSLLQAGGKNLPTFNGRYDVTLTGTLDGKAWSFSPPAGAKPLQLKQYLRLDGMLEHAQEAVVKSVSVRVMDSSGAVKATLTAKLGQPATG